MYKFAASTIVITLDMKKYIIIILTLALLSPKGSYAQTDFRSGYIITNQNDTIHGLIDYRTNGRNARICTFKKEEGSSQTQYGPEEIKAFRYVNSKFYVAKDINVDGSDERLFLEYLINGTVDVYYYRDESGEHYLIDQGDGKLVELKNDDKELERKGVKYAKKSKEYVGVLSYMFRDSPSTVNKTKKVRLNHKSLINIAKVYHHEVCLDEECIVYEKNIPENRVIFGPLVGGNLYSITTDTPLNPEYWYLTDSDFNTVFSPVFGMFLKVNLPFFNERLFFQYEISYHRRTLKTNNVYHQPLVFLYHRNDISVTLNSINHSGMIRYEFPKGKVRPVFQFGGFANTIFKTDFMRTYREEWEWGEVRQTDESTDNPLNDVEYGLAAGIGLIYQISPKKELFIDLKYQRGLLLDKINSNNISLSVGFPIN